MKQDLEIISSQLTNLTPQTFSSYKDMCTKLGLPVLDGHSKTAQLEQLSRYFKWERQGNKYIVTEVYNTPQKYNERRGKNRSLTEYQYLFNTVLLYQLVFGERDEENHNCVSFTKTELRQNLFKLINRDYYNIRKDIGRASRETGLTEETLRFGDQKVTDKLASMSMRCFEELKEEGKIDVTNGLYIYYIDLKEYFNTGVKDIKCRSASDLERNIILSAGWIGTREYENDQEEKDKVRAAADDQYSYNVRRSKKILERKLRILNGVDKVEDVAAKIMKDGMDEGGEAPINKEEYFMMYVDEVLNRQGEDINLLDDAHLEMIKKGDGLNKYAIEKGEFWINIVEKMKFLMLTPMVLWAELVERFKKLKTMPNAQEELNRYMLDWVEDKAVNVWGGFSQKFLNETATGSRDIVQDMMKFAGRYIDIKRVDGSYEWKWYTDETGKRWKVRYASNKMIFNEENLYKSDGGDREVVLWSTPQKGQLCTNCRKLVDMARTIWTEKGWMPIEGHMGGIWDEDGDDGAGKEVSCFILDLGDVGMLLLKRVWEKMKNEKGE